MTRLEQRGGVALAVVIFIALVIGYGDCSRGRRAACSVARST